MMLFTKYIIKWKRIGRISWKFWYWFNLKSSIELDLKRYMLYLFNAPLTFPSGLKIWKWEPGKFHITVNINKLKTPGTTWNHLNNPILFQKWFISPTGLQIWKREPARFHITCWQKGAKNTGNHMEPSKKCVFVPKIIYFTKWAQNLKMGTS